MRMASILKVWQACSTASITPSTWYFSHMARVFSMRPSLGVITEQLMSR